MAYIAANPTIYLNTSVGSGQCVALVEAATGAPRTSAWRRGAAVRGATLAVGTAIAVFDTNGHYGNHTNHTSHAAIYMGQDASGIQVIDQWVRRSGRQFAHRRTIFWHDVRPSPFQSDNGDRFNVVE